uniref:Uncharacterized protein n=1 Tax=uncultured sulfate-reducing bacterium TaxID=153939 RepID=Q3IBR9_9BACT|nr:hypothetical protein 42c90002 [uncultured sulfate-reducing bacterium]
MLRYGTVTFPIRSSPLNDRIQCNMIDSSVLRNCHQMQSLAQGLHIWA